MDFVLEDLTPRVRVPYVRSTINGRCCDEPCVGTHGDVEDSRTVLQPEPFRPSGEVPAFQPIGIRAVGSRILQPVGAPFERTYDAIGGRGGEPPFPLMKYP